MTSETLDKTIMQVFEENESSFCFPLTSQKEAREFLKHLHVCGVSYEDLGKEVEGDWTSLRKWRQGCDEDALGEKVLKRINRPFQETMILDQVDEELLEKKLKLGRTFSLFSVDLEDSKLDHIIPSESSEKNIADELEKKIINEYSSANDEVDKNKLKLCQQFIQAQEKDSAILKQEINSEKNNDTDIYNTSSVHIKADIQLQSLKSCNHLNLNESSNLNSTSKKTATEIINNKKNDEMNKISDVKAVGLNENVKHESQTEQKPPAVKKSVESKSLKSPATFSDRPSNQKSSKSPETLESLMLKIEESAGIKSPLYKPIDNSFADQEVEGKLNYNSDSDSTDEPGAKFAAKKEAGFLYVFCDRPSKSSDVAKDTKCRLKVGASRKPANRLKQALNFNPDVWLAATLEVESRRDALKSSKLLLKTMEIKDRPGWYQTRLDLALDLLATLTVTYEA